MLLNPLSRKIALIAHVTSSVSWFGSVAAFLVLAIFGYVGSDPLKVRASYLAMEIVSQWVIVPLCFATLVTGLIQSFGTTWGPFKHYWVVAKLLITIIATVFLLIHMGPIQKMATVAIEKSFEVEELKSLRLQLIVDSVAALFAVFIAIVLSIIKPKGLTYYGWKLQRKIS